MNAIWARTLWLLLAIAGLVFAPVAILYGLNWGLTAGIAGLFLLLSLHLYHLRQLMGWLEGPLNSPLPRGRGVWEIAFADLHRRVRIRLSQQQVLSETLERFMQAFQALPDGVIAFDRHHHIEWLNERAETHFALSAATDCGQALTNLIRHPDFVAYLAGERFAEPLIYRGGRVDGLTLMLQIIPYGAEQNLLVSRDISQMERMETMRRDFIANVSHELKTPLTVVAGFSEMLADDFETYGDNEIRQYLTLICEQNARMQHLIEDLLTLSALESGGSPPNEERVELEPMLRSILNDAQALSGGQHEIALTIETPSVLVGCANELRSAFSNLAGNAVRYTPAGGRIDLIWRMHQGCGEFVVADTGIGIAAQHLLRLTERFYRVDRSRSRETGGTGLGLAIVKHVLTRHHATLEIESAPGKGSRFTARFPKRCFRDTGSADREADPLEVRAIVKQMHEPDLPGAVGM
ncbi:MAG: phosphate regulon sensor histidine kinase PhoR [Propionivibrio sp.]|uniref:Phosphate regulon sensor protein PhoR n=1 Tax=Candidatus Propionivibrio dominans TaxID=2954373 RepID=A0A9D7IH43_9RHOO|nr:phosphate regulon sensor histidine kinase PhoR [Candidatus Propionivibrio dominans]